MFNTAFPGNALKALPWQQDASSGYGREHGIRVARMVKAMGSNVRGHNLVWPSWMWSGHLEPLKNDPGALAKRITDHITDEVSALKGLPYQWDVVNEPYSNHDVQDVLGPNAIVTWYQTAHAADPNAQLFINDYGITESNGEDEPHIAAYEKQIRYLLDHKAPLGGIGLQSHFGEILSSPTRVYDVLNRMARFKLPLAVTEFDVNVDDEALQADYLRDYLTICFSHPAIHDFILWGFWEGDHWIPKAAMYRRDWTPKPNAQVWNDLVFHQWWTNVQGQTDPKGTYKSRGFLGDYRITIEARGKTKTFQTTLPEPGRKLQVMVD